MSEKEIERNVILVSKKPLSTYILAATRATNDFNEIILKARGKNINTLVNLAEILKRDGMKEKDIKIETETFKNEEGKDIQVSGMIITLEK